MSIFSLRFRAERVGFAGFAALPRGQLGFLVLGRFIVLGRFVGLGGGGGVIALNDLVGERRDQIDDRTTLRTAVGTTL